MNGTMHIENMFTRIATLKLKITKVKYTQESGLQDWEGVITGEIAGTSTSPYYTSQIPNVDQAESISLNYVTSIGSYAFYNCTNLTSVTIPDRVTSIGNSAFRGCSGLTSVTIPDSVTNIGIGAFNSCSSLTSVTMGQNIQTIGAFTFRNCTNCSIFDFRKSTSVPKLSNTNSFRNTPSNKEIIVPDSLYDSWIVATNWASETYNIVNCIVKASQSSLGPLT